MKISTNQIRRFLTISILLFVVFQFSQGNTFAKIYSPVIIEPYDEENLKKINKSLTSLKTYQDKVRDDRKALEVAAKNNASNPTAENSAILTEKTGKMLNTTVKFLSKSEEVLGKTIPEMRKYVDYLHKVSKKMEAQDENTLFHERAKWARNEAKKINSFLDELEVMKTDFNKIRLDFAVITSAWVQSKQMERELRVISNEGRLGSIHEAIAKTIDEVCEIREMVLNQLMESRLNNSSDVHQDGRKLYRNAIEKYFSNSRETF